MVLNYSLQVRVETAVSDDDEVENCAVLNGHEGIGLGADSLTPSPGGPFSALTPSMWPQDILNKIHSDAGELTTNRYDEFGFRLDVEEETATTNSLVAAQFIEDPQHRLKWLAHLEFSHNKETSNLSWDNVDIKLPKTDKLREMVRDGIPHSLRSQIWMRMSGALAKKQSYDMSYKDIVKSSNSDVLVTSKQIEKDLLRTFPANACFNDMNSTGVPRLRRVLRALAWLYPDIGYCQGSGMIAGSLLLFMEEEDAFWLMCTIVEDILPASYYSPSLLGVQADQRVLRALIDSYLPEVDEVLRQHDIEISLITLHWFLTIYASVVHMKLLLRIWDMFFFDGSIVIFQISLGMLKLIEPSLKPLENSAQIFNALSDIPGSIDNIENLFKVSWEVSTQLTDIVLETHRRRHLAYLMADEGGYLVGDPESARHLPKQHLTRRQMKKSKSVIQLILFGDEVTEEDIKSKNIRQTEILVDLREAILQVARHFITTDPKQSKDVVLVPDYSIESHSRDHDQYLDVSRTRKRRAKALLDFERHDDDELGFRKNDIITIVSQKDEHCWIGELNGLRGWFPAKFVEILDERSKQYSCAGDDSVSEVVTDLVRGTLCPAIKQVLEHGMRRPSFLGGPCHPWLFIEEVATKEVERDFSSVYSRLVLCKTYRLDEDGKVLTPEELLYRCVQAISLSHDNAHAQMDVKLRSLVCLGLNEQVLHLWLEILCSSVEVVQKWYQPWSFMCSPGWVQIKCELRMLSQFAFNLNPDWELPTKKQRTSQPLKDGVRDMLVKHHLFSWDL
ncbi:small G protein signaling modulator 3 homolog isoform X2 [Nilaparvata lugens]|uniref:small G protein signaling modulator 3 homolog isoform X2 n=1 Tax=Nilaparvata lugens TaxID=108931 RepID=UPI00193D9E2A|nr:small G protein signaling modulator 3 homolog isoform X2 [Nilaparvata lugens]